MVDVLRIELHGPLQMPHGVIPVCLRHEAAAEQGLREEALDPRQPLDLRIPGAEDVVGVVVVGIELDGAARFVVDEFRVAHTFLTTLGARQAPEDHREHVVPLRVHGVGANRPLGVAAAHRI